HCGSNDRCVASWTTTCDRDGSGSYRSRWPAFSHPRPAATAGQCPPAIVPWQCETFAPLGFILVRSCRRPRIRRASGMINAVNSPRAVKRQLATEICHGKKPGGSPATGSASKTRRKEQVPDPDLRGAGGFPAVGGGPDLRTDDREQRQRRGQPGGKGAGPAAGALSVAGSGPPREPCPCRAP